MSQKISVLDPVLIRGTLIQDKKVAAALGVSRSTVWALTRAGKLAPVKLAGKTTRFRSDEVIALIEGA